MCVCVSGEALCVEVLLWGWCGVFLSLRSLLSQAALLSHTKRTAPLPQSGEGSTFFFYAPVDGEIYELYNLCSSVHKNIYNAGIL